MLEREIGFLEDELKSLEGLHPASRSCKEVVDFVTANADPLIPTTKKTRKSCRFWKRLCNRVSCFNLSWLCCCAPCPSHCCSCNCNCCGGGGNCTRVCETCRCSGDWVCCRMPNCSCFSSCRNCGCLSTPECLSSSSSCLGVCRRPPCSWKRWCTCFYCLPKCLKFSFGNILCCGSNSMCCYPCYYCY
ncbi:guanine nucleotide-binding protein subunit gamma 3 isoform X2 [Andrographis paniculata]|nr:guanine nucleotide-binding protein subunit gamma 3 isoform X2 [Andrographis paniculata]